MLENYSKEELERRSEIQELNSQRPKVKTFSSQRIVDICENYMDSLEKGENREDDPHYMFEDLLITVYGKDVFDWINKVNDKWKK